MTLHSTTEVAKKVVIGASIGIGSIVLIVVLFRVGVFFKDVLFPPKIDSANEAYGKIPELVFPQSTIKRNLTYTIDTLNGSLPTDFPDRLIIYPMVVKTPSLLDLQTIKRRVQTLGFFDASGNLVPEIPRGGASYEWDETTGLQRKIIYDIVTQNFILTSNYLTSLTVLNAQNLGDETTAFDRVQGLLGSIDSYPDDIDSTLTKNPSPDMDYVTKPQLFAIVNGVLQPTTSLSNAQVIRVDLYQKEIDYSLTAGQGKELTHFQNFDMKLPILYPHPPHSTIHFFVASGSNGSDVVDGSYTHQTINLKPDQQATYPIKTPTEAFDDLKNGRGYVAAYNGTSNQILINKVYLAYYLGEKIQQYLMPIIVFEGQDGFFAYVSAVQDSALN